MQKGPGHHRDEMVYVIFGGISLEWVCGCEATLATSGKVLKVRKCWCGRIHYVVEAGRGRVLMIKETQSHRSEYRPRRRIGRMVSEGV